MRLFTAIGAQELSFDPNQSLKKLKINLDQKEVNYRWIPQQNLHITINFLGEVEENRVPELKEILSGVAREFSSFDLKIQGVTAYPKLHAGRVLVLGVQNSKGLRELQARCSERLKEAAYSIEERDYRPHITLVRLRSPKNVSDMISPVKNTDFGTLEVNKITLYQSKLGGSFPVYEPLANFPLH